MNAIDVTAGTGEAQQGQNADCDASGDSGLPGDNGGHGSNGRGRRQTIRRVTSRASKAEIDYRVNALVSKLADGANYNDVTSYATNEWGISPGTAEHYLQDARKRFVEIIQRPVDELRAWSLGQYRAILAECVYQRDKIKCLERIDKLLGLESPTVRQVEVSGKDGGPIQSQASVVVCGVDLTSKLAEVGGQIRQAALATLLESLAGRPSIQAVDAKAIDVSK